MPQGTTDATEPERFNARIMLAWHLILLVGGVMSIAAFLYGGNELWRSLNPSDSSAAGKTATTTTSSTLVDLQKADAIIATYALRAESTAPAVPLATSTSLLGTPSASTTPSH